MGHYRIPAKTEGVFNNCKISGRLWFQTHTSPFSMQELLPYLVIASQISVRSLNASATLTWSDFDISTCVHLVQQVPR